MGTQLLKVTDLHAYYGESHVLQGVDCRRQHAGEVVALLGRNGAGTDHHAQRPCSAWSAAARAPS
jgi:ABC-type branched-subunit amino acid transport system ATPase component